MKNFLSKEDIIVLQEAHHAAREKRKADRIKTVLLLNQGYPYSEIARILLINDSTAREYFKEYKSLGLDGLVEDNYSGSESFLTTVEQQGLTLYLKNTTYHTVKQVVVFVEENLKPQDRIYFLDASHPHHNNKSSYGWIPKGEERWIKTNTGRKRLNINGALSIEDLNIITRLEETINADAMILMVKNIEDHQPEGEIYLILDNARYNHAIKVKEYVEQSGRIHLVFLPSYSPNLNIIERLWLFFHQKILYDKYYETFPEFKETVLSFFQNINIYRKELKSRLTDSFQVIPA